MVGEEVGLLYKDKINGSKITILPPNSGRVSEYVFHRVSGRSVFVSHSNTNVSFIAFIIIVVELGYLYFILKNRLSMMIYIKLPCLKPSNLASNG